MEKIVVGVPREAFRDTNWSPCAPHIGYGVAAGRPVPVSVSQRGRLSDERSMADVTFYSMKSTQSHIEMRRMRYTSTYAYELEDTTRYSIYELQIFMFEKTEKSATPPLPLELESKTIPFLSHEISRNWSGTNNAAQGASNRHVFLIRSP
uniref:Uncharacterized protein n=1 Tax=Vespula pensylvanica TaxID=30213 RepID=A0A834KPS6_VESPE|nr:hypothetical protein H0235_013260 [Vespula pensylvanica]